MRDFLSKITIKVNEGIYLKDPESSDLGKRIIAGSIDLIDRDGFENFTFRKLSTHINSTEASIYRYFENKHKLLLYLTNWYWSWMESRIVLATINIDDPREELKRAMMILSKKVEEDSSIGHINEIQLDRIIMSDSSKAYLHKSVDAENKEGLFSSYKSLVTYLAQIILKNNPQFKYPNMLVSTIIEGIQHQRFFAEHIPVLTNSVDGDDTIHNFYQLTVNRLIETN
jgi:AcrR family transcriptional regulator